MALLIDLTLDLVDPRSCLQAKKSKYDDSWDSEDDSEDSYVKRKKKKKAPAKAAKRGKARR